MKKEELLVAIRAAKGIPEPEAKKDKKVHVKKVKVALTKPQLKQKVRELRAKKEEALQQNNWKVAALLKKKISRFKKMTRRVAT